MRSPFCQDLGKPGSGRGKCGVGTTGVAGSDAVLSMLDPGKLPNMTARGAVWRVTNGDVVKNANHVWS